MTARALIVGAARSGSGKTSVSVGLMRALRRRGLAVRGAKSGPDYIDPGFHAAATGAPGVNLDSWAMPPDLLDRLAGDAGGGRRRRSSSRARWASSTASPPRPAAAAPPPTSRGATASPVLLILDVSGQSQTAAAIARGFATHDPGVRIAGVILNQVASPRHERLVRDAVARARPAGGRRRAPQPGHGAARAPPRAGAGARARGARGLHRPARRRHGRGRSTSTRCSRSPRRSTRRRAATAPRLPPPGQRIAIAEDAAFSFVYPHLVRALARGGRRARALLAARRRGADPSLRRLLAARRLPGAARRPARRGGALPRRPRAASPPTGRCTANAAASWCSAARSRTPTA